RPVYLIMTAVIAGGVALGTAYGLEITSMQEEPPLIRIIDENTIRRHSYIPRVSLDGSSWYDRVIENYCRNEFGQFELSRRTTQTYHYPISGGMQTDTETEIFKADCK
ncbi:hypothetical protein JXC34_06710, partial [Candidatus Woesearchaeota archaeon]|nr:hypothetical protein [Candidatus Woesearchaeota archaeon]